MLAVDDAQAFTTLYNRYRDKLYSFALDLSHSEDKAKDVVHDVFAQLWERRASLSGREILGSYLFTMTRNRRIDQLRRFSKETLILAELAREQPSPPPGPDALLDYQEMQAALRSVIRELPPRQQEVYAMRREQGLSYDEIAARLDLSPATVENHFTRALQNIRSLLHRHFTNVLLYSLLMSSLLAAKK